MGRCVGYRRGTSALSAIFTTCVSQSSQRKLLACTFVHVFSSPSCYPAAAAYSPRRYRYSNDNIAARTAQPKEVGSPRVYWPCFITVAAAAPISSSEHHSSQIVKQSFSRDKFRRLTIGCTPRYHNCTLGYVHVNPAEDTVNADVTTPHEKT